MSWLRRLLNTLRSGRLQRDIDREVSFHIAERVDELRAAGHGEDEARRRARRQFGNPVLQAERTRDMDIAGWLDAFFRNVRYAIRTLARRPAFTITVVLTLALGIGANSAVFSALDAVLLRPLPFPEGDRLMRLTQTVGRSSDIPIAPGSISCTACASSDSPVSSAWRCLSRSLARSRACYTVSPRPIPSR